MATPIRPLCSDQQRSEQSMCTAFEERSISPIPPTSRFVSGDLVRVGRRDGLGMGCGEALSWAVRGARPWVASPWGSGGVRA